MAKQESAASEPAVHYTRFDLSQRIEHIIFLVSFSLLGLTGLVQKYAESPFSQSVMQALGGIENTRWVHHIAAFVLMAVSIFHIINALYRIYVLRVSWTMMPVIEDFKHLFDDIRYNLGMRKHKAYYGRYNYGEKVEYLAVVWGTIIMAITGFMMWNPIVTTRILPGEFIPAAKAAHGAEAVLAVLSIIVWHFYNVHVSHFNKSMFTGKLSENEMAHEHPAELDKIKAGQADVLPPADVLRRRKRIFFPTAIVLAALFSLGLIGFVTIETTAITTIPPGETAAIFVPLTATPRASPTPAPSPTAGAAPAADSWDGYYEALFRNRCSTCHSTTRVSGLSLATYRDALTGGSRGPAIVPGKPEQSMIVQMQQQGGHPGQLSKEELQQVIEWIEAGAPEN
jgi:cytochrome b subunit of formate dehydrogenase/mono/diheme cytochrome c family protein